MSSLLRQKDPCPISTDEGLLASNSLIGDLQKMSSNSRCILVCPPLATSLIPCQTKRSHDYIKQAGSLLTLISG